MRCLSLLVFIALVGCTTPPFTPAERLAGEWTCAMDGSRVHLTPDGRWTYYFTNESGPTVQPGTFEATWKTISFQADDGNCVNVEGRYNYELALDTLLFTMRHDECPGREIRLQYAWTRMIQPNIPAVTEGELEAASDN